RAGAEPVTRVARVTRVTRLDELPQLWNVLKGDMSFVGPRPERPFFVQQLADTIPFYMARHSVKPGLTGWAQVRYRYGSSVEDALEKLRYDLYYIKHLSLVFDMTILIDTLKLIGSGKGAKVARRRIFPSSPPTGSIRPSRSHATCRRGTWRSPSRPSSASSSCRSTSRTLACRLTACGC